MPLAMCLGAALIFLGMITLSLCRDFYQIVLAQGICVAFGAGLIYVPTLAFITSSFTDEKRPVAVGLAAAGIGVGS